MRMIDSSSAITTRVCPIVSFPPATFVLIRQRAAGGIGHAGPAFGRRAAAVPRRSDSLLVPSETVHSTASPLTECRFHFLLNESNVVGSTPRVETRRSPSRRRRHHQPAQTYLS